MEIFMLLIQLYKMVRVLESGGFGKCAFNFAQEHQCFWQIFCADEPLFLSML